jgi:hypothetical protein
MGLDMYLEIKNVDGSVGAEVAYWRKANQIHNYFVKAVQNGSDDCEKYDVTVSDLKLLYDLCRKALIERNPEILPPCEGFFFGSTDVDEYYWHNLIDTCIYLAPLVNEETKGVSYVYQSSW